MGDFTPVTQTTSEEVSSGRRVSFGVFEADFRTGELRKNGIKVKLHAQPLAVLKVLLEHAGEVVTRDELQQKLWGNNTFVDFEHGLNKAINKLREALNDDAETPRYIQTLPRRGYRFIAPLTLPKPAESAVPPEKAKPRWRFRAAFVSAGLVLFALGIY